jgi:Cu/Ag efflux protein CusF
VIKQFEKTRKVKISAKNVILLDDDIKNIDIARSCKMQTLHITDDNSLDALLEQR